MSNKISADQLRRLLDYDPITGVFKWRPRADKPFDSRYAGKEAGTTLPTGYRAIHLSHRGYLCHRLAWLYHYGTWPQHHIDHVDRNPLNNAIANLRDATPAQNNQNKRMRIGKSGRKGVHRQGSKWIATTEYKGKRIHFGTFLTVDEAAIAYEGGMQNIETLYQQRKDYADRKPVGSSRLFTHGELLSHFHYDPLTGQFHRIINGKLSQTEAGHVDSVGYRRFRMGGKKFPAHVLAVFYMTGTWPTGIVDHINGIKFDNRWSNLRVVSHSLNALNRTRRDSIIRGVRPTRNKIKRWESQITLEGKAHHIGTYNSQSEAIEAWMGFVKERGIEAYLPK